MGPHGPYRAESKGQKSGMPKPPFVKASRMPCDAVKTKKNPHRSHKLTRKRRNVNVAATSPSTRAKLSEWVKPRWPSVEPYRYVKNESKSGTIGKSPANTQKSGGIRREVKTLPKPKPTMACV